MNMRSKAKALVKDAANSDAIEPDEIGRSALGVGLLWALVTLTVGASALITMYVLDLPSGFGGFAFSAVVAVGIWWFVSWFVGLPSTRSGVIKLLNTLDARREAREANERRVNQKRKIAYLDARSRIGKSNEAIATFDLLNSQAAELKVRDALFVASRAAEVPIRVPENLIRRGFPERSPYGREVIAVFYVGADAVELLKHSTTARTNFNARLGNVPAWLGVEFKNGDDVSITIGRRYLMRND